MQTNAPLTKSKTAPTSAPSQDVALSCRVRLARNLEGVRFPNWADEAGRSFVSSIVASALKNHPHLDFNTIVDADSAPEQLLMLQEEHLASRDLLERGSGGALVIGNDPGVSIMLNEEDHIRIQVIRKGIDIQTAWREANRIDDSLEEAVEYAFSPALGYLTACPSNIGTGLRASVMVHLLGLRLTDDLEPVLRSLEALRLAVRGAYGEGSEAAGSIYQISNQGTLGYTEEEVIETLLSQINELIQQEHSARQRLLHRSPRRLHDCVTRSLAVLQNSRLLTSDESMDYLSALRLGVQMHLVHGITIAEIDELMLLTQPAHLPTAPGQPTQKLEPIQRDTIRSDWMRARLAELTTTV